MSNEQSAVTRKIITNYSLLITNLKSRYSSFVVVFVVPIVPVVSKNITNYSLLITNS